MASTLTSQPTVVTAVNNTSPQQPVNSKFIRHLIGGSSTKINEMQKFKASKSGDSKGLNNETSDDANVILNLKFIFKLINNKNKQ